MGAELLPSLAAMVSSHSEGLTPQLTGSWTRSLDPASVSSAVTSKQWTGNCHYKAKAAEYTEADEKVALNIGFWICGGILRGE